MHCKKRKQVLSLQEVRCKLTTVNGRSTGIPADAKAVENLVASPDLLNFTDSYVDNIVQRAATKDDRRIIRALAQSIRSRQPPKLLREVQVCEESKRASQHDGSMFMEKCRTRLKSLARKYHIPLGQFLLCYTPQLRIESRGPFVTPSEARRLPEEREEELVKIFLPSQKEPKSLVSVGYSLVSKCADYFWQAFRLYVICRTDNQIDKLADMRKEVQRW